jgi:hypothetical protein
MPFNTKSGASLPTNVGAAASATTAHRHRQAAANALRMRRRPHRGMHEVILVEPRVKRGNSSITLVTPLS